MPMDKTLFDNSNASKRIFFDILAMKYLYFLFPYFWWSNNVLVFKYQT